MLQPNVYILIPVHNRKPITLKCLSTLQQDGDLERYHVVVIDDGSTDGTAEAIHEQFPGVEVLTGGGDLWWTGAMRLGMEYAIAQGAEFLIWLNDDCQLVPSVIAGLVSHCQTHPGAIAGAQGYELDHPTRLAFGGKTKTWKGFRFIQALQDTVVPCDLLSGNLVCLPREVVTAIGYPDPQRTPHYGGDSLYLIRAAQRGFQLWVDNRFPVFNHPGEPRLYPSDWLLAEGSAWRIWQLVFVPQSGLSWRVWWHLNWEAYRVWGIIMFLKKYSSIVLITGLRLLPRSLRQYWRSNILVSRPAHVKPS